MAAQPYSGDRRVARRGLEAPAALADVGGGSPRVLRLADHGAVFPSTCQRLSPYLAEFVGTYLLTMTFIYNFEVSNPPVWTATSNGFMVMALTYTFGHVSGANMSPSISLALLMAGRQSAGVVLRLCFVQILGCVGAALTHLYVARTTVEIGPRGDTTWRAVVLVEIVFSAALCFVYLNCVSSTRNNPWHSSNGFTGLSVGFIVLAGGFASRKLTSCVMNSAIAVGLGLIDSRNGFNGAAIGYFFADLVGAFLATWAYRMVRPYEAHVRNVDYAAGRPEGASPRGWSDNKPILQRDPEFERLAAEFIGTFLVTFTKGLNRLGDTSVGPEAWSVAAMITGLSCSLRGVSGAFFNPAVTLAAMLGGRAPDCRARSALLYMAAQVLAGMAASSLCAAMNHGKAIPLTFQTKASLGGELFAESSFVFLITYVVLTMSVTDGKVGADVSSSRSSAASRLPRQNDIAGFAYGACHVAGGFAAVHISGALLNPAIVLSFSGVDVVRGHVRGDVFAYLAWQVIGALLALGAFVFTHPRLYVSGASGGAADGARGGAAEAAA